MEPTQSEKQENGRVYLAELAYSVTIKPDEDLPKERLIEIIHRIDDVQDDLEFIRDWLKRHLKDANDVNADMASYVRGDAFWAWDYLQAVYRLLVKVMNNAEDKT